MSLIRLKKPLSLVKNWLQWENSQSISRVKEWISLVTQERMVISQAIYSEFRLNRVSVTSKTCLPVASMKCRIKLSTTNVKISTKTIWSSSLYLIWPTWMISRWLMNLWPILTLILKRPTSKKNRPRPNRSINWSRRWVILTRHRAAAKRCPESIRLTRMETSDTLTTLNQMIINLMKK